MFRIASEKELLECFRPMERDEVILPEGFSAPVLVKDYFAWLEPSGCRAYIVASQDGGPDARPIGIVFRRDQSAGGGASMCEWCRSVRSGGEVGLLTATASSHRRVGIHLCRDLSCREKIAVDPGAHDFPALRSPRERTRRMVARMLEFARRELF